MCAGTLTFFLFNFPQKCSVNKSWVSADVNKLRPKNYTRNYRNICAGAWMSFQMFCSHQTIMLQSLHNSKQIVCNDLKPTAKIIGLMIVCVLRRWQFTHLSHSIYIFIAPEKLKLQSNASTAEAPKKLTKKNCGE